jgi:CheY-like chemotaxis protein
VAERLSKLRRATDAALYDCDAFERTDDRLALRLGNRFYPHMKLVVEPSPSRQALFRADAHDDHVLALVGPSHPGLDELMAKNQAIARAIEESWSALHLPTAGDYWRGRKAGDRAAPRSCRSTVLVVDDEDIIRETVGEFLEDDGFRVVEAANGRDGLEVLERERPALVVLDLMMPVMSGWEFREEQKRRQHVASTPVIVMTAHPDARIVADRVFHKPFDPEALLGAVHELVDDK